MAAIGEQVSKLHEALNKEQKSAENAAKLLDTLRGIRSVIASLPGDNQAALDYLHFFYSRVAPILRYHLGYQSVVLQVPESPLSSRSRSAAEQFRRHLEKQRSGALAKPRKGMIELMVGQLRGHVREFAAAFHRPRLLPL